MPFIRPPRPCLLPLACLVLVACGDDHGHDHPPQSATPAPASTAVPWIELPAQAQANLGLTWATAEYRVVAGVLRMPGRFESEPGGRRTYAAPLAGRIDLLVQPYAAVAAGTPLYRLHSPAWQTLQQELADAEAAISAAADDLTAGEVHAQAIAQAIVQWQGRLTALERLAQDLGHHTEERAEAAGRVADLRIAQAQVAAALATARRQAGGAAQMRFDLLLAQAAAITGLARAELLAGSDGRPAWSTITAIEIRATHPGIVEGTTAADGAWTPEHEPVLTVTDPAAVRLAAAGLQADLQRFASPRSARIVAADPAVTGAIPATLVLGPSADAVDRSLTLVARPQPGSTLPAWARPGITAALEVVVSGTAEEELAIPVAATIRDGLRTVLFRRDRAHPDRVFRMEADLGASDGRQVAVLSGLQEGDQVVLGGIYPLMLSQQGSQDATGHFHADGTFHEGKH